MNKQEKNILLIVEGKKLEPLVFTRIIEAYNLQNINIIPVGTHIYSFMKFIQNNYGVKGAIDFSSLDLPLILDEFHKNKTPQISINKYTDIILIFDYECTDSTFTTELVYEYSNAFNDSTDTGKLYINYPMFESFKGHFKENTILSNEAFNQDVITKSCILGYKQQINKDCSKYSDVRKLDNQWFKTMINMHLVKLNYIFANNGSTDPINFIDSVELCKIQNQKLLTNNHIYSINTSLLWIYEEYPSLI